MYTPDQYSLTATQRALVTYSNSATGEIRVKIPSVLGSTSEIFISKIGRQANAGVWSVPDVGSQIVVSYDDYHLTNVFWMQTDAVVPSTFTYKVGDTGPGGGIIFFVDRFNEYSGFTYLEVAPVSTQVQRTWATDVNSNQTTAVSGADSKALGSGYQNTLDIVAQTGNVAASCAAAYCADLVSGGQSDWYLPSLAEIKMVYDVLYVNLGVGGFASGLYWSSSEYNSSDSWIQNFMVGVQINYPKTITLYVSPVRKF
jgi:hypothetical protein